MPSLLVMVSVVILVRVIGVQSTSFLVMALVDVIVHAMVSLHCAGSTVVVVAICDCIVL